MIPELEGVKSIALVGAHPNPARPAHRVMKFLLDNGFEVLPVNPGQAGSEILGQRVYASLAEIPVPFQMVDIFRNSEAAGLVVDEAIALAAAKGIGLIWMQIGVVNEEAAQKAEAAGLKVVMNRCPMAELGSRVRA